MGVKYFLMHNSPNGQIHKTTIEIPSYNGEQIELIGVENTATQLKWNGDENPFEKHVIGSQLTLNIYDTGNIDLDELMLTPDLEYRVKYYIDNERTSILLSNLKDKEMLPGGISVSKQGKVFDGSTEVASCLLARDYKGLGNQSMTAVAEPNRLGGLYDKDGKKRQAGAVWDKESIGPTLDTMQGGHREPLTEQRDIQLM